MGDVVLCGTNKSIKLLNVASGNKGIATVIFSLVKIICYIHVWRDHVIAQKFTWYFIGVYIINKISYHPCFLSPNCKIQNQFFCSALWPAHFSQIGYKSELRKLGQSVI